MEIRWATPFDISQIAAMLIMMHKEASTDMAPINSEKMIAAINDVIHNGIVLVALEDNHITGSIGGKQGSDWWSNEKYFADLWFYVAKDFRKSKTAMSLVKHFIGQIKETHPDDKIRLGHIFSGDCDRKDKFFKRIGFEKVGSVFMEA
jgi:L-amino acid N-acyltransferase YncA|tara:strand:+ start:56 stop:499 length:444 start_codon:yes stop_codon:yes gene_type:complete